jgi:hypothetical protein
MPGCVDWLTLAIILIAIFTVFGLAVFVGRNELITFSRIKIEQSTLSLPLVDTPLRCRPFLALQWRRFGILAVWLRRSTKRSPQCTFHPPCNFLIAIVIAFRHA